MNRCFTKDDDKKNIEKRTHFPRWTKRLKFSQGYVGYVHIVFCQRFKGPNGRHHPPPTLSALQRTQSLYQCTTFHFRPCSLSKPRSLGPVSVTCLLSPCIEWWSNLSHWCLYSGQSSQNPEPRSFFKRSAPQKMQLLHHLALVILIYQCLPCRQFCIAIQTCDAIEDD